MTEPVNNKWIEILDDLDKISEYNKLGGRGHGDLADNCYICGISPSILKAAILSKLESIEQEAVRKAQVRCAAELSGLDQQIMELKAKEQEAYKKGWQERGDYELRKYENDKG